MLGKARQHGITSSSLRRVGCHSYKIYGSNLRPSALRECLGAQRVGCQPARTCRRIRAGATGALCWRKPAARSFRRGAAGPRAAQAARGNPPLGRRSCGASWTDSEASRCAWRGSVRWTAWTPPPSRGACRASVPRRRASRLLSHSYEVTAAPSRESRCALVKSRAQREGERTRVTRTRFPLFSGRCLRRLGERGTIPDFWDRQPWFLVHFLFRDLCNFLIPEAG